MLSSFLVIVASALGFSGILLDAIGAHALPHWISDHASIQTTMASWNTAVRSQMLHAVFLLSLAALCDFLRPFWRRMSAASIILGLVLFSGSIYLKALTNLQSATQIAPLGGMLLMFGWISLGIGIFFKRPHGP